jgi:glycogen operon protein
MNRWHRQEGAAWPLGVSWVPEEEAYNFALYSKHATEITLLMYARGDTVHPRYTVRLDPARHKSGRVWHCRVPAAAVPEAAYYAYSADGPADPQSGHRFDARKILFDPYAPALFFPDGFSRQAAVGPQGNAGLAPLGVLRRPAPVDWTGDVRPSHSFDTIVYELHVRSFTRRPSSGVPVEKRGTFAGLVEKIPYLLELGVTAVELLPIFAQDPQEGSFWGYMPLSFFALHDGYAVNQSAEHAEAEFCGMVRALHAAGIEVLLDVVYSHTAEGGDTGPTYSYRGLDNDTYYLLTPDRRRNRNDTGCGNTLHCANRYVRRMIVDSLLHWAHDMHVDGFRFDLASIFARASDGSLNLDDPPAIGAISGAPDLAGRRLIAEAWDLRSSLVGRNFPATHWFQWNGRFRDDLRALVRGDAGAVPAAMTRLYGSTDLFPDDPVSAYHAYQGVNFITSHDGFTLYDLVAYDRKHNEANGHDNTDGAHDETSWNCGWEGDAGVPPAILELRTRQARNFCALLMLANGTPMLRAGDEFLHTQHGNNNPYNQDNETSWLDWDRLQTHADVFRFFRLMIAFRKAHPSIARSRFWRADVRWYGADGPPDLSEGSRSFAYLLSGATEQDADLYVMINMGPDARPFAIQDVTAEPWRRVIDTSVESPGDFLEGQAAALLASPAYDVQGRSVVVLMRGADRVTPTQGGGSISP